VFLSAAEDVDDFYVVTGGDWFCLPVFFFYDGVVDFYDYSTEIEVVISHYGTDSRPLVQGIGAMIQLYC